MDYSVSKINTVVIEAPRTEITFQQCMLILEMHPGNVEEYVVPEGETLVGATDECHVIVDHPTVSRRHFKVTNQGGRYLLEDLGSTNGTHVDGVRVKEAYLKPGSSLRAGDVHFRFQMVNAPAELTPSSSSFGNLAGECEAMRRVFAALEKVAPTEATCLLLGETGTGKGATARAIHQASRRADGPFVVFDCGRTAPTLVESELFGHEKGAFTGAVKTRTGALAAAKGGTLFIDELADLPLDLQPRLLRALEEREFTPVGSDKPVQLDCRIVASAQRDLAVEVEAERFRRDLLFRVSVVTIPLPPLRDRLEDLPLFVDRFLGELGSTDPGNFSDLPSEVQQQLTEYHWPGNIRELRNVVERICVLGGDGLELGWASGQHSPNLQESGANSFRIAVNYDQAFKDAKEQVMDAFERTYLEKLLARSNNNIAKAARDADINRRHLYTLLSKHGLGRNNE